MIEKKNEKKKKKGRKKKELLGTSIVNMANTEYMRTDQHATTAYIGMSTKKACVQQRHDCIEKLTCMQRKGVRKCGYT